MAVNKVEVGGETLIDISDSTVTADTLSEGSVAYGADGERITGRNTGSAPFLFYTNDTDIDTYIGVMHNPYNSAAMHIDQDTGIAYKLPFVSILYVNSEAVYKFGNEIISIELHPDGSVIFDGPLIQKSDLVIGYGSAYELEQFYSVATTGRNVRVVDMEWMQYAIMSRFEYPEEGIPCLVWANDFARYRLYADGTWSRELITYGGESVTDEHINELIDAKLGAIENGTY